LVAEEMTGRSDRGQVAILFPGDRQARLHATAENNRFADLFRAFAARAIGVEPAVYHDDFSEDVRQQLTQVDAVLVWSNPIEDGRDRTVLDSMLRDVAAAGVFVSTHPDIILKLGTKEVVYQTRAVGWGCDTHLYDSIERLRRELPKRLATGRARVLKQNRGHGGNGVWKVQLKDATPSPWLGTVLRVRHAKRGCTEEEMTLGEFSALCEPYFARSGRMIDQEYQERLPEGMVRCYLVHDHVAGFGHQAINALFPAAKNAPPSEAPQPGPRLYHPPTKAEFQVLKQQLEQEWVPAVQQLLDIETDSLPILWDCDFLLGPKTANGDDSYVLCEINVSSVAPYPESAVPGIVEATARRIQAVRQTRRRTPDSSA
jgi:hypothetical protein